MEIKKKVRVDYKLEKRIVMTQTTFFLSQYNKTLPNYFSTLSVELLLFRYTPFHLTLRSFYYFLLWVGWGTFSWLEDLPFVMKRPQVTPKRYRHSYDSFDPYKRKKQKQKQKEHTVGLLDFPIEIERFGSSHPTNFVSKTSDCRSPRRECKTHNRES